MKDDPKDAGASLLELADKYEAGLRKMEAAGYEEFDQTIREHKIVIAALRATPARCDAGSREALDRLRKTNAAEYLRVVARETKHQFDRHELPRIAKLIDAVLSLPATEGERKETDAQLDERLARQEARDNLRLLDYIADKIGVPHDQELSREDFNLWFSKLPTTPSQGGPANAPPSTPTDCKC